uniref:Putative methyltransferase n=1 Tax=viral metagenome TaxID=1070528 RepID=A0A6M3JQF9_9ZZZZ
MKPKLLDLFCCQGGATKGLQRAGFYVVGVDINPQPRYCGDEFIQADAMKVSLGGFDAYWASPPCQEYTKAGKQWRASGTEYPDLIEATRERLVKTGKPYIIENVPGSPLINPIVLNGAVFGMNVHRVRWFECSFDVPIILLPQNQPPVKMGRPVKKGDVVQPVGHFSGVEYAGGEMGIDWMNQYGLSQAIPPAYSEFLGRQMLAAMGAER